MRAATCVLLAAAAATAAAMGPIRNTTNGLIQGMYEKNTESYLGIPFAAPPVGDLRWQPPAPANSWAGVRSGTQFGNACPQHSAFTFGVNASEDCLYLNVYVPKNASSTKPLPVVLFWYGGSWEFGAASFPLYWATWDLEKYPEVILVSSNYRLGPLGFLASHSLQSQTSDGSVGNFGIQDQRAAMHWIQDNIAAFGGDPKSVTIQGESAGAGSVSNHIMMPRSKGLFHRGITESGPFAPWSSQSLETSMVKYNQVAIKSGCYTPKGTALRAAAVDALGLTDAEAKFVSSDAKVLDCLRTKSGTELAEIHVSKGLLSWSPVVDGVELTDTVLRLAKAGKIANPVPVLGGTNRDEGTLFVPDDIPKDLSAADYIPTVAKFLNNETVAKGVEALYPLSGCKSPWWCVATMLGDAGMTCPTRATAFALNAKGMPYYRYFFQHELEVVKDFVKNKGVFHGSELVFVFDIGLALWEKAEKQLSAAFVQYWYNFIATGNPNGAGLPTWPLHDANDALNVLDTDTDGGSGIHSTTGLKKTVCDFWDTHPVSLSVIYGNPLTPSSSTSVDDDHSAAASDGNPLSMIDGAVHAASM